MRDDPLDQGVGITHVLGVEQMDAVPVEQTDQWLPRSVETERPRVSDAQRAAEAILRGHVHPVPVVGEVAQHGAIGTDDTFGFTGRTGGEDEIGAEVGLVRHRWRHGFSACDRIDHRRVVEPQNGGGTAPELRGQHI